MGTNSLGANLTQVELTKLHSRLEKSPYFQKGTHTTFEREFCKVNRSNQYLDKTGYQIHYFYRNPNKKWFSIFLNPHHQFINLPNTLVTFHQSHFNDQLETTQTISEALGFDVAREILLNGKYFRLDLWYDIEESYNWTLASIYRARITSTGDRKALYRTRYFGSKKPMVLVVYEKLGPAQLTRLASTGSPIAYQLAEKTRIELRLYSKKIPISCYADYWKLQNYRFPQTISLTELDRIALDEYCDLNPGPISDRLRNYLHLCDAEDRNYARTIENTNRDFSKRLSPILARFSNEIDLSGLWQEQVRTRIVKDFDIKGYFR